MRKIMKENDGIGLAAPQIGLDLNLFVAEIDYDKNKKGKFYALINPQIISKSKATEITFNRAHQQNVWEAGTIIWQEKKQLIKAIFNNLSYRITLLTA